MSSRILLPGLRLFLFFLHFGAVSAAMWYVDDSVLQSGNGISWGAAFKQIQEGIDAASDGDTVLVARGVYYENMEFKGKNIVLQSADALHPAVIDGGQRGPVVTFAGTEDESCMLSGFRIRNGRADCGGGIRGGLDESHTRATIVNNRIASNFATGDLGGGGLAWCDGLIANNLISGNSAVCGGGGLLRCHGSIRKNIICGNSAKSAGGLNSCDAAIWNNTIYGNSAYNFAGGLGWCRGTICNCIIWGNKAAHGPPAL